MYVSSSGFLHPPLPTLSMLWRSVPLLSLLVSLVSLVSLGEGQPSFRVPPKKRAAVDTLLLDTPLVLSKCGTRLPICQWVGKTQALMVRSYT